MTREIKKPFFLLFGVASYLLFLVTFCYLIGFVADIYVPKQVDGEPSTNILSAIFIDTLLILLFAIQHSVMARPAFKTWWHKIVPEPIGRSMYNFLACVCLLLLFHLWQPLGGTVWKAESFKTYLILTGISALGFTISLISTFLVNHFDLGGLRQVWMYCTNKNYQSISFRTPGFYKYVRHPLYFGLLIGFWITPVMTVSHLFFATLTTIYILIGVRFEEKDLVGVFGSKYVEYQRYAPMLFPFTKRSK